MKITRVVGYPLPFAFVGGGFNTSYGPRTHLDNLLLEVHTDQGLTGYGEMCRVTGAHPRPTDDLAAVNELVPRVLGMNPLAIRDVNTRLHDLPDRLCNLRCALDVACWDLLAQRAGLPLFEILGGHADPSLAVYVSIGQEKPAEMAARAAAARGKGCKRFQMKVGGEIEEDAARIERLLADLQSDELLLADANGGWSVDQAIE